MAANIHPSAVVDPAAKIDPSVTIGPFCVIGPDVTIGAGTEVGPYCMIDGVTTIGRDNRFYRYCSIGGMPQDKKYDGERTRLTIGDRNTVRDSSRSTRAPCRTAASPRWAMTTGSWPMCMWRTTATLATTSSWPTRSAWRPVHVGDWAIIGGLTGAPVFAHRRAFHDRRQQLADAGCAALPAGRGQSCRPVGVNVEGLRRRGFSAEAISALREAYKIVYRRGLSLTKRAPS